MYAILHENNHIKVTFEVLHHIGSNEARF
jgi:hypothetical protein